MFAVRVARIRLWAWVRRLHDAVTDDQFLLRKKVQLRQRQLWMGQLLDFIFKHGGLQHEVGIGGQVYPENMLWDTSPRLRRSPSETARDVTPPALCKMRVRVRLKHPQDESQLSTNVRF